MAKKSKQQADQVLGAPRRVDSRGRYHEMAFQPVETDENDETEEETETDTGHENEEAPE